MEFNKEALQKIRDRLINSRQTIAIAESVTSGNLQAALSQAKDASLFFQGGITTYNLGQKYKHLNVEPIHAEGCLCVSQKVAEEMAINVCRLFRSDYGVSITGFAAKMPEKGIDTLYAFVSIAMQDKILLSEKVEGADKESHEVQSDYTNHILIKLAGLLTIHNHKSYQMKKELKKENGKDNEKGKETAEDLKKESTDKDALHKGYNEKNPSQPQGAFTPESKNNKS